MRGDTRGIFCCIARALRMVFVVRVVQALGAHLVSEEPVPHQYRCELSLPVTIFFVDRDHGSSSVDPG